MTQTDREMVRNLCKSILNRLMNQGSIEAFPERRNALVEEVFKLVGPYVLTEQDLHEKALEQIGLKNEVIDHEQFSENEQYRAAKSVIRKSFGDDELRGFYYQKNLRELSSVIAHHFMKSSLIEEVYDSDDELTQKIVEIIKRYNPKNAN